MSQEVQPNWVCYDLDALARNFAEVRRRVGPDKQIFAALKGNAYGHGALACARVLERAGMAAFMTGSFEEACEIRAADLRSPIVMFAGALPEGLAELIGSGLIPTVVDRAGAEAAAAAGRAGTPAEVHVKVDMGLGRLGVAADEVEDFLAALAKRPGLRVAGLYTHLPFADRVGCDWARERYAAFDALLERLERAGLRPPVTQAGASSSVAAGIEDRASAVCVGHLLYGLSPFSGEPVGDVAAFERVFCEVGSRLVQVAKHHQGQDIAIAGNYGTRSGRRIGVAPIGAAQGLQRVRPGARPQAIVRGRRVPILSVSLEHLTLDLDDLDDAAVGDRVYLLGGKDGVHIALEELAGWFGLSCLDTVLAINGRLPAVHRGGD
jgi:alanine racemase